MAYTAYMMAYIVLYGGWKAGRYDGLIYYIYGVGLVVTSARIHQPYIDTYQIVVDMFKRTRYNDSSLTDQGGFT